MTDAPSPKLVDYPYHMSIPTRWRDVDLYSHVNNVVFYIFFDTIIGHYLMTEGGMDYTKDNVVGFAVESQCRFLKPLRFPDVADAGLRVTRIGNSSVTYEVGIFKQGDPEPAAFGYFVHVFVDRTTDKSTPIPSSIRTALERILVPGNGQIMNRRNL